MIDYNAMNDIYNEESTLYFIGKLGYYSPLYTLLSHYRRLQSTRFYQNKNENKYQDGSGNKYRDCNRIIGYCNGNFHRLQSEFYILT